REERLLCVHHAGVVPADGRVAEEGLHLRQRERGREGGRSDQVRVPGGAGGVQVRAHGSALADGEGELPNLLASDQVGPGRRQRAADVLRNHRIWAIYLVSRWSRCLL